jgi:hypothetical protein
MGYFRQATIAAELVHEQQGDFLHIAILHHDASGQPRAAGGKASRPSQPGSARSTR